MLRYLIAFIVMLAACFGIQSLALRANGGSTTKSESNYFSSVARLQAETQKKSPRAILLGSSLTGRLADRGGKHPEIANLGCDGGSAVITLRAMDQGKIPTAPWIIIEANTLGFALENRGSDIANAINSKWFDIGKTVPNLSATARPSAFGYSWLMARGSQNDPASSATLNLPTRPIQLLPVDYPDLSPAEHALVEELSEILARLREKGCRFLIVQFPAGDLDDAILTKIPTAFAARSGAPYWDINDQLPPGAVNYTDGRHLDGPSAKKLMNTLLRQIGQ
ncbi:MAG: hypothetical protein QM680_03720 [Luteolibacter sp.]